MLDLEAMAVFTRVVEAESFSGAARALGISKSAVSKQLARLEDRLGVRLMNRTTRRLSLTEAGASFLEGCQRMVAEAEAAERAVTHLAAAPRGTLRVNAPMSFGTRQLAPRLPQLLDRCPELTVDLVLNDRRVDLVEEGFDVGIRIGKLTDSSLVARSLTRSRHFLCAAPSYVARRGAPGMPKDLSDHDCLLYSYLGSQQEWRFQGAGGLQSVRVRGRLQINNGEALTAAAMEGFGIVLQPSFICGPALRSGSLIPLLPDWREAAGSDVHAVYPASRNLSPKVRAFVDFLAEEFAADPIWEQGLEL